MVFELSVSHTSGNISTFLPDAISNAYIFMSAVTAYAFKRKEKKRKEKIVQLTTNVKEIEAEVFR